MKRSFVGAMTVCAAGFVIFVTSAGAEHTLQFTVEADGHDRDNSPVTVLIDVPKEFASETIATITDAEGNSLPGQITELGLTSAVAAGASEASVVRELHFILPKLAAEQSRAFTARIGGPSSQGLTQFQWTDTPGRHADLSFGNRPVLRYMYEAIDNSTGARRQETCKPYHHVFDPRGERLVTKGPGGLFPHHRGLFYGFNRVTYGEGRQADTWHCNQGEFQSHEAFLSSAAGPVLGRHRVAIDWHGQDGQVFAKEQRELTAYNTPGGTLIEFASRLESQVGHVKLDGDPQHAGFHFRASQEVPDKTKDQTYYLRPDGQDKPGSFRNWPAQKNHVNLPWNALCFVLDGRHYTCCYLDRPSNPKEARFSERDYGRFGSYFEYDLETNTPLTVDYRIWLQEGEMTVAQVAALSHDFVEPAVAKRAPQSTAP